MFVFLCTWSYTVLFRRTRKLLQFSMLAYLTTARKWFHTTANVPRRQQNWFTERLPSAMHLRRDPINKYSLQDHQETNETVQKELRLQLAIRWGAFSNVNCYKQIWLRGIFKAHCKTRISVLVVVYCWLAGDGLNRLLSKDYLIHCTRLNLDWPVASKSTLGVDTMTDALILRLIQ